MVGQKWHIVPSLGQNWFKTGHIDTSYIFMGKALISLVISSLIKIFSFFFFCGLPKKDLKKIQDDVKKIEVCLLRGLLSVKRCNK